MMKVNEKLWCRTVHNRWSIEYHLIVNFDWNIYHFHLNPLCFDCLQVVSQQLTDNYLSGITNAIYSYEIVKLYQMAMYRSPQINSRVNFKLKQDARLQVSYFYVKWYPLPPKNMLFFADLHELEQVKKMWKWPKFVQIPPPQVCFTLFFWLRRSLIIIYKCY